MKIFRLAGGYHSLGHQHNSTAFLHHGNLCRTATLVNMEARQPTSLMSQSSSMKAKLWMSKTALMKSAAVSSTHDAHAHLCAEFPQQMLTTQHMMQAGSNLILSGISDTTVMSWVSRPWAKCVCAEDREGHICSKALNLVRFEGNKQAKKK